MRRKSFIELALLGTWATAFTGLINSCREQASEKIKFIRSGANSSVGHRIRESIPANISVSKEFETEVLIVGGGISGLTAGYFFQKNRFNNFIIAELDEVVGGNSKNGKNEFSKYPYGAHYIPIPNLSNKKLIDFLREKGLIKKFDGNGLPVYDEFALCQEPEERLLIHNYWQEGIVPSTQITQQDAEQTKKFFDRINDLRMEKGTDEKFVFDIPLADASKENPYLALDRISFASYLKAEGYTSPKLLWYLQYCCRDDYGQSFEKVSAFAGLHYFASRRGKGANCEDNSLLTWPEGNGKLVQLLSEEIKDKIYTRQLVRQIEIHHEHVETLVYDWKNEYWSRIKARKILLATPCHVSRKILSESNYRVTNLPELTSQPWLVASITARKFSDRNGFPLSWDNVMMESKSLGFVFAQHQSIQPVRENFVFTLYKPLDENDAKIMRLKYYNRSNQELQKEIIAELSIAFPQVEKEIQQIDCHLHGHGMISPGIGYLMNPEKNALRENIQQKIFFAHTDYSGISIFEEAFWQGHTAANEILNTL